MNSNMNNFLTEINPVLLWISISLITLAVIVIAYFIIRLNKSGDDKQIEEIIKQTSNEYIKDAIISDGMYGYFFIDYLINLSGKIILIGVEHYEGYIFGGDTIDEWAQVVNNKSYKFKNPLQSYIACAQMLNDQLKGSNAIARIVFTSVSEFPKGVPESVFLMEKFQQDLETIKTNSDTYEATKPYWQEIVRLAQEHKEQYSKEK
jgi:hypothetical protein